MAAMAEAREKVSAPYLKLEIAGWEQESLRGLGFRV